MLFRLLLIIILWRLGLDDMKFEIGQLVKVQYENKFYIGTIALTKFERNRFSYKLTGDDVFHDESNIAHYKYPLI